MIEREQRARVVAIAMAWERTPYVHQARLKGLAADCTFIAAVFVEAGLMPEIEVPRYSAQAHLNRESLAYLPLVERHAKRQVGEDAAKPGDVVMYQLGRGFSHGGIIIDPGWPAILHADAGARFVIRADGRQGTLAGAERRFFSFW